MFEQLLSLLERLVVAQETIAKNSSGKPTSPAQLESVAGKKETTAKNETAAARKKREAAEKKAAIKEDAAIEEATKADATKSVDKEKAVESSDDAGEVSPEDIKEAQVFKKKLLGYGRGHDDYTARIKAILGDMKAETVPVEMRDEIEAAVKAEFEDEGNDDDI